jgi:hypothetical protein
VKLRYNIAFDAFNAISKKNYEAVLSGVQVAPDAIERERRAMAELDAARKALLDAIAMTSPVAATES